MPASTHEKESQSLLRLKLVRLKTLLGAELEKLHH